MSDDGEIHAGPDAGFNGRGRAFRASRIGHFGTLADLHHKVWLVERAKVTPARVAEHALILPETLLDPAAHAHARRWMRAQPLLCVSGLKQERLARAGTRVVAVEVRERGGRTELVVELTGGELPEMCFVTTFDGLRAAGTTALERARRAAAPQGDGDGPEKECDAPRDPPRGDDLRLVDRVLRHLSGGFVTELGVVNALAVRNLIEPGYGYHGAPFGTLAPIEEVHRGVRALEALFAQIDARAAPVEAEGREIAASLAGAPQDAEVMALPGYGEARRTRLDALALELAGAGRPEAPGLLVDGAPERRLDLAVESRWSIASVKPWEPTLPPELLADLEREEPARRSSGSPLLAALVVAAMVVLLLWALARLTGR
jgi:hypothetical protein